MAISTKQKAAMAEGRKQGRVVNDYLTILQTQKPKRGRKRTPESIQKRLAAIEADLGTAQPAKIVQLVAERKRLANELQRLEEKTDTTSFEAAFVEVAREYSSRKNITYPVWREIGVPADVLKRAGITRQS